MTRKLVCLLPTGGEGTRLLPHTRYEQKPLLLMGHKSRRLMDFALCLTQQTDHTYMTVSCNPIYATSMRGYVSLSPHTTFLQDIRRVGVASLLDHYEVFLEEDVHTDIVVLFGDHIYENLSLAAFHAAHQQLQKDVTVLVTAPKAYGEYILPDGAYAKSVSSALVERCVSSTGVYMMTMKFFCTWMREEKKHGWNGEFRSLTKDVIFPAIYKECVALYKLPDVAYWDDCGTIERYFENNMRLSKGYNVVSENAVIHPDASIDSSVILGAPYIGKNMVLKNVVLSGKGNELVITQL